MYKQQMQWAEGDISCYALLQERATSSNWQTAFNAINVLCGVGLLTTPYAMAITGTSALLLLIVIGECQQCSSLSQ